MAARIFSQTSLKRSPMRQRGLTLVELVITIVIVSIAIVASLTSFSVIVGRSSDALIQSRTLDLAQLYLDEILSKRFDEAAGVGGIPTFTGTCRITDDGESRADYDDVDDFDEINNESPALVDSSLAARYSNFQVSVTVSCDSSVGTGINQAKRIQLTITSPDGDQSVFAAYKGNY